MADLVEALGEHVMDEAPEQFDARHGDATVATGADNDPITGKLDDATVRERDTVRISAEIFDDGSCTAERALRVDVPAHAAELAEESVERLGGLGSRRRLETHRRDARDGAHHVSC